MHILFAIIPEIAVRLQKSLFQKIGIALAASLVEGIMVIIINAVDKAADDLALAKQAGRFQVINAGQVGQVGKTEMVEKGRAGAPCERPARRAPTSAWLDPAKLKQDVDGAARQADSSDFLDLGASNRLVIGNDGQHLEGRARQRPFHLLGSAEPLGYVCSRAKGKGITDPAELDAAAVIKPRFDQRQQALKHDAFRKLVLQIDSTHGLWRRENDGFDRRSPDSGCAGVTLMLRHRCAIGSRGCHA